MRVEMEFAVVEFVEEKSVAAVPSVWLSEKGLRCFWPKSGPNVTNLVKNKAKPDKTWTNHPTRVLKRCGKYSHTSLRHVNE